MTFQKKIKTWGGGAFHNRLTRENKPYNNYLKRYFISLHMVLGILFYNKDNSFLHKWRFLSISEPFQTAIFEEGREDFFLWYGRIELEINLENELKCSNKKQNKHYACKSPTLCKGDLIIGCRFVISSTSFLYRQTCW